MPTPNPEYKENWEEIHDERKGICDQLNRDADSILDQLNELYEQGLSGNDPKMQALTTQHNELHNKITSAHNRVLETFRMQHKTVQEYAEWMWSVLPPNRTMLASDAPHINVDFETFTTLDQVSETWSRIKDMSEEWAHDKINRMDAGYPDGNDIFCPKSNNQVFSYWKTFSKEDLYGSPNCFGAEVNTLISVDTREGEHHVCFMYDSNSNGQSPINVIENLAQSILRDARLAAETHNINSSSSLSNIKERLKRMFNLDTPKAEQFKFYIHIPPNGSMREKFSRVDMDFKNGNFLLPEWHDFDNIPAFIQDARYNQMQDVNQEPPQNRLLPVKEEYSHF